MKTKLLFLTFFLFGIINGVKAQVQLTACDINFTGTQNFDLTSAIPQLLGNQNPNDFTFSFHISQTNAQANVNPITNPTSFSNMSNPQLIWVRFVNTSTNEVSINSFSLQVLPVPNLGTEVAVACDDNNDGIATFDFTSAMNQMYQANNASPNTLQITLLEGITKQRLKS